MNGSRGTETIINDFIQQQGPAFLAHLLRRLADELVLGAAEWYPMVGINAPPRTISTLLALEAHGPLGITELAGLLHQSHPLVITWIRGLEKLALVKTRDDPGDKRRRLIVMTAKGRRELAAIQAALVTMERASSELLSLMGPNAWQGLWTMDRGLREAPFAERLHRAEETQNQHARRRLLDSSPTALKQ